MTEVKTAPADMDPWETGKLGRDEQFVECAPEELRREIDEALELQMVSMRLQKDLISMYRGIGYRPLIRDILGRFARPEIILIAKEAQEKKKALEPLQQECAERKQRKRA